MALMSRKNKKAKKTIKTIKAKEIEVTPEEKRDQDVLSMFKKSNFTKQYNTINRQRDLEIIREQRESFDNLKIKEVDISNLDLRTKKFNGALFENMKFENCNFQGCDFSVVDNIKDVQFIKCDFRWATVKVSHFHQNVFLGCNQVEMNKVI